MARFSKIPDFDISSESDSSAENVELTMDTVITIETHTVASLYPSFVASDTCSSCVWAFPGGHFCQ